jgi:hypothetical protein
MDSLRESATVEHADSTRRITSVTRRDIFDGVRAASAPWHGRLDEIEFLEGLYDLRALPSTDSRPEYPTAREDIGQHRLNNYDWDDDWILEDDRFGLLDGPDEVLLRFLARMVHPEVQSDVNAAARQVDELNRLIEPDGWKLRALAHLSGRPIYSPVAVAPAIAPAIALPLLDDEAAKLDIALGQTCHLLAANGQGRIAALLGHVELSVRRDGGWYHPTPGDNWTADTYDAVLAVDAALADEFTPEAISLVWEQLRLVLGRAERGDVRALVIEAAPTALPAVAADWRQSIQVPTNQGRRERAAGIEGYPTEDELVFASEPELTVYQVLKELQRERPAHHAIAIAPLPGVRLRDNGVRSPDFLVIGSGRAVVLEVDGPHHYARTRKADDSNRDRHWSRCGLHTIRIPAEYAQNREELKALLREEFTRHLLQR